MSRVILRITAIVSTIALKKPQFLIYISVTLVTWEFNFFKYHRYEIQASKCLRIFVIYSFFWDVKQLGLVFTDVSEQNTGPIFRGLTLEGGTAMLSQNGN